MLAALDLARRIEAGELTPRAVVELCAEAIAAKEATIGAFVTLDLDGARRAADEPGLAATCRCTVCRSGSKTSTTPPTCRPNTARRFMPGTDPAPTRPRFHWCAAPAV